jgi:hypothetical protein
MTHTTSEILQQAEHVEGWRWMFVEQFDSAYMPDMPQRLDIVITNRMDMKSLHPLPSRWK